MEKRNKILGGCNLTWLFMLLALCNTLSSRPAWAQDDPKDEPGAYRIEGEVTVGPGPEAFEYQLTMPETEEVLYWSVSGARTINGQPAAQWAEGSLSAVDNPVLNVQWSDSIPFGRLMLRYVDSQTEEVREKCYLLVKIMGVRKGGIDGYRIEGEAEVRPGPEAFTYHRDMPETDDEVYWSVSGAKTINGVPAEQWPEGSLNAKELETIEVVWQDSIPAGRLALRRFDIESGEPQEVWWFFAAIAGFVVYEVTCANSPDIQWKETPGATYTDIPRASLNPSFDVCLRNQYKLRFNLTFGLSCSEYIWKCTYATVQGHEYSVTWKTNNQEIPAGNIFYTNSFTTTAPAPYNPYLPMGTVPLGIRPYSFTTAAGTSYYSSTPSPINPYGNENIATIQLDVSGSSCGPVGVCGTKQVITNRLVAGLRPPVNLITQEILPGGQPGAIVPAGQALCLGHSYRFSATAPGADRLRWTSNFGSIDPTGMTTVLTLPPATAANIPSSIQVNAVAARPSQVYCLNDSPPATFSFAINQTPQPQNPRLSITSPVCSFPTTRTLLVDPVAGATGYKWQLVAGNATLVNAVNGVLTTTSNTAALTFNASGIVVGYLKAYDDCNRASVTTQFTFTVGQSAAPDALPASNLPPTNNPTALADLFTSAYPDQDWITSFTTTIPVRNPKPGVVYSFALIDAEAFTAPNGPYDTNSPRVQASLATPSAIDPNDLAGIGTTTDRTGMRVTANLNRLASVTIEATVRNACTQSGVPVTTYVETYKLVRPLHTQYYHRSAGAGAAPAASVAAPPQLYPNPTSDRFRIVGPTPDTHYQQVIVLNALGVKVQEAQAEAGVEELSLKLLPAGIYAVRLFDGQRFVTQRIVKE